MRQSQLLLIVCIYLIAASVVFASDGYPTAPDTSLTPGVLCLKADAIRYPEKIAYCDRNVDSKDKWAVISRYTKKYHFVINDANRIDFKIDHYIPLCMGGANVFENLWPQHSSVFKVTDALEELLCDAMAEGKLSQKDAIEKMKLGKNDLSLVPALIQQTKDSLLK